MSEANEALAAAGRELLTGFDIMSPTVFFGILIGAAIAPPDPVAVDAVAEPVGDVVALRTGLGGEELVSAMLARPAPVYLVVDPDGRPQGVILSADMNTLLRGR